MGVQVQVQVRVCWGVLEGGVMVGVQGEGEGEWLGVLSRGRLQVVGKWEMMGREGVRGGRKDLLDGVVLRGVIPGWGLKNVGACGGVVGEVGFSFTELWSNRISSLKGRAKGRMLARGSVLLDWLLSWIFEEGVSDDDDDLLFSDEIEISSSFLGIYERKR